MPADRLSCTLAGAADAAARVRARVPPGASVAGAVREIVADVRAGGDEALLAYERRFGGGELPLRVAPEELDAALAALDADVLRRPEVAIANVRAVAEAGVDPEAETDVRARPQRPPARGPRGPRRDLRPGGPQPVSRRPS